MVAVVSRAALIGEETHDAWVAVFVAITKPPADPKRAACPNCGNFAMHFAYLADARSRVGLCALWCERCRHGHTLSRVRVPDGIDFVPLDAPDDVVRNAIPTFHDAAAHESERMAPADSKIASRLATLRPDATESDLLNLAPARAHDLLSPREREVAALRAEGRTVAQIAASLHIAPATVRSHVQRAYWKLGHAADRRALSS